VHRSASTCDPSSTVVQRAYEENPVYEEVAEIVMVDPPIVAQWLPVPADANDNYKISANIAYFTR